VSSFDTFILDVDGVLTDGTYYYTEQGKVAKKFGADDSDALHVLQRFMNIVCVSGDHRGFEITRSRVERDMKLPLFQVSTNRRVEWLRERYDLRRVIYMGDGLFDHLVFSAVGYSIAPAGSDPYTLSKANFVTTRKGGDRAVAEATVHILQTFFAPYDPVKLHTPRDNTPEE
jgi:3-deoxy-D-manno-octulosonate 8-phosphate phosphatase (KDO 8-P phosphatase)